MRICYHIFVQVHFEFIRLLLCFFSKLLVKVLLYFKFMQYNVAHPRYCKIVSAIFLILYCHLKFTWNMNLHSSILTGCWPFRAVFIPLQSHPELAFMSHYFYSYSWTIHPANLRFLSEHSRFFSAILVVLDRVIFELMSSKKVKWHTAIWLPNWKALSNCICCNIKNLNKRNISLWKHTFASKTFFFTSCSTRLIIYIYI